MNCASLPRSHMPLISAQELELFLHHCYGQHPAGSPSTESTVDPVDMESLSNLGDHLGVRQDMMQRLCAAADTSKDSSDTRKGSHQAAGPDVIWCSNTMDLNHLSDVQFLVDGNAIKVASPTVFFVECSRGILTNKLPSVQFEI